MAAEAGGIDISMNVISHPFKHGTPLAEMALDDFTAEVMTAVSTTCPDREGGGAAHDPARLGRRS